MKRKAIVIGANKNRLKYAVKDAERVAKALEKSGYTVKASEFFNLSGDELIPEIKHFLKDLVYEDQVLFYFAGHGFLENHNSLYFALESSDINDRTTCLGAKAVSHPLEECSARNKIVILDCCHAGAFSIDFRKDMKKVNYALIYASEGWERAVESETEIGGGVFTNLLLKALSGKFNEALNKRGELTPGSLSDWLSGEKKYFQLLSGNPGRIDLSDNNSGKLVIASFEDKDDDIQIPDNPEFFTDDRDGQSYPLMQVDDLIWMGKEFSFLGAEKQYVLRLRNENDEPKPFTMYSLWQANEVCPKGWRIPSLQEWEDMINFIHNGSNNRSGSQRISKKLEITSTGCFPDGEKPIHLDFAFFWTSNKASKFLYKVLRYNPHEEEWTVDLCRSDWKISCLFVRSI